MDSDISRRTFLKGTAAAAAAGAAAPARLAAMAAGSHQAPTRLMQFPYAAVELLEGRMLEQFQANHEFFLALDEDSMLRPFRLKAGLPTPGAKMGGWYSWSDEFDPPDNMTGYIPGHSFGQYLSALSRAYAITGNKATQAKVFRLVREFAKAISPKFYQGYPLPCYTFDKINYGLSDAHQFAQAPAALPALARATDAVMSYLPPHALTRPEMRARPHPNIAYAWDESYTLPENLFIAWKRSGDKRYLDLAQRFLLNRHYFDPLAEGDNVLPGLHAYSHVNALSSASQAFLVLGDQKYLRAARNGMNFVIEQSYVTGGWGPNETFVEPGSGTLGRSLTSTHASFETGCGSFAHAKIVRYLMRITGESVWGDSLERVFYNATMGEKPIEPGGFSFYYSDYNNSGSKVYYPQEWPCCSGTFPQVTADYGISSYFHSSQGVYVNLFVPSRVKFRQQGTRFSLEQRTKYPYANGIAMHLWGESPRTFTIALRVPRWAGKNTEVEVNGKRQSVDLRPGQFLEMRREWKSGDVIEYNLDQPMHLEAVDAQHPNTLALMRGPLALFAINAPHSRFTREQLLAAGQQGADGRSWKANSATAPVTFKAFPDIRDQQYRLYHQVAI